MASRALAEYEEALRRRYHQDLRRQAQDVLEQATPRLQAKGWRVKRK